MENNEYSTQVRPRFYKGIIIPATIGMVVVMVMHAYIGVLTFLEYQAGEADQYHSQHLRLIAGSMNGVLFGAAMLVLCWAKKRWLQTVGCVLMILFMAAVMWQYRLAKPVGWDETTSNPSSFFYSLEGTQKHDNHRNP